MSETATLLQGAVREGHAGKSRNVLAIAWIWLLLAILTFLVIYPVLTLLLGALTDTNPVVDLVLGQTSAAGLDCNQEAAG